MLDATCMYFKTFWYLYELVVKMNDDSKSVYGGTKSPVSVSDEKVRANQDRVYF